MILLVLFLAGCRSSQPVIQKYYLIESPEEYEGTWPERISVLPGTCLLSNVQMAPAYATHQIALREDSHQIRYFSFNEWAIRPEIALTRVLSAFFVENPVFENIKTGRVARATDYVLETEVLHLELDTRDETLHARLHLQLSLLDGANQNNTLHTHTADRSVALEEKNLNLFAAAISRMFTEELHAFSVEVLQEIH